MAHLASRASREARGRLGCQVLQATRERRVYLAAREPREALEMREKPVPEDMLGCKVLQDLRVNLGFLARLAWKAFLDLRVIEGSGVLSELRGWLARGEAREREDQWASQDLRASQEPRETRDSKENLGRRETLVTLVWKDWQGRRGRRVCLVSRGPKDSKE